ncbi:MAG: 2-succinyl-5-enolpyruvyl-6-hydroxy-3-cyclohexene-1-carboxylic-acid synthase, partial [Opitutales bacterium]|nr:2-succinyl-5-enolpyruvyl-6-hydroxy-3-cyclohexene-1-carboxylic-acid synthase [Opitutales bacterium]
MTPLSDKSTILQLVALAYEHGVRHVVLCPGSRNAPIVHSFAAFGKFCCHSVTDERSAGFFAIGIAQKTAAPVAVCVTSGTALANLYPAVAEAFYQEIPLVVISADRPHSKLDQLEGQTIPQAGIFGRLSKFSADLPEGDDPETLCYANRLVNEALLACTFRGNGPVHINVPLSEPLFQFSKTAFPQPRVIRRSREMDFGAFPRRMIVCGQSLPQNGVPALDLPGFVCLAEHLANGRFKNAVGNFDALLAAADPETKRRLAPDLLITVGGHIVSKTLRQFLRDFPPREHWQISPDGSIADTFGCLTATLAGTPEQVLAPAEKLPAGDFEALWRSRAQAVPATIPQNLQERAVQAFMQAGEGNNVHLANSSSVRLVQKFPCRAKSVFCNRGTSGIEGTLSAALGGNAVDDKALDCVLIGDLSFFYDMNALCIPSLNSRLRILLLNNGGGGIFHKVPGLPVESEAAKFILAPHKVKAADWARSRG